MNEFEECAEAYMRSAMKGNEGDMFTRSDLCKYIIEAWKHGYADGATTVNFMQCQDCPKKANKRSFMVIDEITRIKDEKWKRCNTSHTH